MLYPVCWLNRSIPKSYYYNGNFALQALYTWHISEVNNIDKSDLTYDLDFIIERDNIYGCYHVKDGQTSIISLIMVKAQQGACSAFHAWDAWWIFGKCSAKLLSECSAEFAERECSAILLWQEICRGYHAILMQNSVCEDSEVSRSRLPIRLHCQS